MSRIKDIANESKSFNEFSQKLNGFKYSQILADISGEKIKDSSDINAIICFLMYEYLKTPKVKKK